MSIDANVVGLTFLPDGTVRMVLEQPDKSRCAGQPSLIVTNKPPLIGILLDRHVWGGDQWLMCGEIKIGERRGYTGLVLDNDALAKAHETGAGWKPS